MFSERCELRKGLAVLDARERQLNWKIRSKENYIRRLESLGAGPEKKGSGGYLKPPLLLLCGPTSWCSEAHSVVRAHL